MENEQMASYIFGSGYLFLKDGAGSTHQVGVMSDVQVDFEATSKELRGSQQYPLAVAIASRKASGKAKSTTVDGKALSSLLSGSTATGRTIYATNLPKNAAASVYVGPVTGSGMNIDLGVLDASNNPMSLTSSAPAIGAYAVNTGTATYTFNAGQTGQLAISFGYGSTTGYTTTIAQQDQGVTPTYELHLQENFQGETFGIKFVSVSIPKLGVGFKSEDFAATDLEFQAQANAAGQVGFVYWE
jgi:hypothetical protein